MPDNSQKNVSDSMQAYVQRRGVDVRAMLMLGDNWYDELPLGADDDRWRTDFEEMYPETVFNCPIYAVAGNHDYQHMPVNKLEAELEYARRGGTRWTLPSLWYRLEFPKHNPLLTILALDSNYPQDGKTLEPVEFTLTEAQQTQQMQWLKNELSRPRTTPFLAVMAHHALYSNKPNSDNPALIRLWDPLFREHAVDMYLAGHHHDLQHMEFEGHPTSFVVSGGGGAHLDAVAVGPGVRGPFAQMTHGFSHLEVSPQNLILRHVGLEGQVLHTFVRDRRGRVSIIA